MGLEQGNTQAASLRSQRDKQAGGAGAEDGNIFFHAGTNREPHSCTRLSGLGPGRPKQGLALLKQPGPTGPY